MITTVIQVKSKSMPASGCFETMPDHFPTSHEASIRDMHPPGHAAGEHRTYTQDEQLLNRSVPPMPRPLAPELAFFTRTESFGAAVGVDASLDLSWSGASGGACTAWTTEVSAAINFKQC